MARAKKVEEQEVVDTVEYEMDTPTAPKGINSLILKNSSQDDLAEFQKLVETGKAKLLSKPSLIKLSDMQEGEFLVAKLIEVLPPDYFSSKTKYSTNFLKLELKDGTTICATNNAAVASVLTPEDNENKYVGKMVCIRRTGTRTGKQGKRDFPIFDVIVK